MATDNPLNDNFRQFRMEYDTRIAQKYVAKENGKGLSTNDFTDADKQKLATLTGGASGVSYSDATTLASGLMSANDKAKLNGIANSAQVNTIETIKIDGSPLPITNKSVDISLSGKVDKVSGKQLSTEDYTTTEKQKLAAIDTSKYVLKDGSKILSDNNYTTAEKQKLAAIDTSKYVTIVSGKGLSTEDYTTAEKQKLASLTSGTNYTLPTASASTKGGAKVTGHDGLKMEGDTLKVAHGVGLGISSLDNLYLKRATADEKGGVIITGNDGLVMDGETLKANISNATTVKAGLMSKDDKTKLDSFKAASQYVTVVSGKGLSTEDFTTAEKQKLATLTSGGTATDIADATTVTSGFMSAADKIVLDRLNNNFDAFGDNSLITSFEILGEIKTLSGKYSFGDIAYRDGGLYQDLVAWNGYDWITLGTTTEVYGNMPEITHKQAILKLLRSLIPTASSTEKGVVRIDNSGGFYMDGDLLRANVATSLASGFMSKDDKIKLNSLDCEAINAMTENADGSLPINNVSLMATGITDDFYEVNKPRYNVQLVGTNYASEVKDENDVAENQIYMDQHYIKNPKAGDLFYNYRNGMTYIYVTDDLAGSGNDNNIAEWYPVADLRLDDFLATTTENGLMSREDKIKLDKFSFLETQKAKDDGTVTKYVVPNYYDIYLFCGSLAVHDMKNNDWHAAYVEQSWLNEALNYLTNGQYTSYDEDATYPVTDADILQYCIDKGYIDSSQINLEEAEIVKLINIYCRSVQMGKFLVSHEVVYDSETNTVDRHQLAIAVDTDEDGTSDFMFVIPGDLETRLTSIESNAASLDSRVDALEAVDAKAADFDKVRIKFSDFNKLMANFATVSAG